MLERERGKAGLGILPGGGDGASCFRFPCWPDGDRSSGVPDSGQAAETCYSSGIGKVSVPSLELLSTLTTYK